MDKSFDELYVWKFISLYIEEVRFDYPEGVGEILCKNKVKVQNDCLSFQKYF